MFDILAKLGSCLTWKASKMKRVWEPEWKTYKSTKTESQSTKNCLKWVLLIDKTTCNKYIYLAENLKKIQETRVWVLSYQLQDLTSSITLNNGTSFFWQFTVLTNNSFEVYYLHNIKSGIHISLNCCRSVCTRSLSAAPSLLRSQRSQPLRISALLLNLFTSMRIMELGIYRLDRVQLFIGSLAHEIHWLKH